MKSIAPGVYTFEGLLMGRVYLLEDPDGLTIIDGSIARATDTIFRQLNQAGHPLTAIRQILLTHAHPDHVGALAALQQQSGAPLITSEGERAVAAGEIRVPVPPGIIRAPQPIFKGIRVDRTVREGDVIDALGGLQVIDTPGHAPGHISYWQPERKILFAGDAMMHLFGSLRLPMAMATVDMPEAKRSIKKLAALEAQVACFGHGNPMMQGTSAAISAFARRVC